jgi:glyoxylase-like metal-dependent hydrolase (beta-lactamase superfamily II)
MPELIVYPFPVGPLQANCVILAAEQQKECVVFDCGDEPDAIEQQLQQRALEPALIVLTHGHVDHIAAADELRARYPGVPVAIHEAEAEFLSRGMLNLSMMLGTSLTLAPPERLLQDGETIEVGRIRLRAIHVPGHSPGGMAFYAAPEDGGPLLIAGDIIFAGSIGRTDFPGGDHQQLLDGIRRKLYTLPDETVVYPGHGPETSIGDEKQYNQFVRSE